MSKLLRNLEASHPQRSDRLQEFFLSEMGESFKSSMREAEQVESILRRSQEPRETRGNGPFTESNYSTRDRGETLEETYLRYIYHTGVLDKIRRTRKSWRPGFL